MAYYLVAFFQPRRRRFPTAPEPILKEFIRQWVMVPDGNCRHGSQSRRVINEKQASIGDDYIMSKLILGYNFRNDMRMNMFPRLRTRPSKYIPQRTMLAHFICNVRVINSCYF
jgi:hypothetical protein